MLALRRTEVRPLTHGRGSEPVINWRFARSLVLMASDRFRLTCCPLVRAHTANESAYGFLDVDARFSLVFLRTGAGGELAFPDAGELIGNDVETFPGGGEPSAVKSTFCSASVFDVGTGKAAAFFIRMTFAVTWKALVVRPAVAVRLSAHTAWTCATLRNVDHCALAGTCLRCSEFLRALPRRTTQDSQWITLRSGPSNLRARTSRIPWYRLASPHDAELLATDPPTKGGTLKHRTRRSCAQRRCGPRGIPPRRSA